MLRVKFNFRNNLTDELFSTSYLVIIHNNETHYLPIFLMNKNYKYFDVIDSMESLDFLIKQPNLLITNSDRTRYKLISKSNLIIDIIKVDE